MQPETLSIVLFVTHMKSKWKPKKQQLVIFISTPDVSKKLVMTSTVVEAHFLFEG